MFWWNSSCSSRNSIYVLTCTNSTVTVINVWGQKGLSVCITDVLTKFQSISKGAGNCSWKSRFTGHIVDWIWQETSYRHTWLQVGHKKQHKVAHFPTSCLFLPISKTLSTIDIMPAFCYEKTLKATCNLPKCILLTYFFFVVSGMEIKNLQRSEHTHFLVLWVGHLILHSWYVARTCAPTWACLQATLNISSFRFPYMRQAFERSPAAFCLQVQVKNKATN